MATEEEVKRLKAEIKQKTEELKRAEAELSKAGRPRPLEDIDLAGLVTTAEDYLNAIECWSREGQKDNPDCFSSPPDDSVWGQRFEEAVLKAVYGDAKKVYDWQRAVEKT